MAGTRKGRGADALLCFSLNFISCYSQSISSSSLQAFRDKHLSTSFTPVDGGHRRAHSMLIRLWISPNQATLL
jgi:hypothetical protein